MPCATISTRGSAPSLAARSFDITTTAAAPSETWDALPAVMVPSLWNAGVSLLSVSTVVSGLTPSSRSSFPNGTTSSLSTPPFDQAVVDHRVDHLGVAHAGAEARPGKYVRGF